MSYSQSHYPVLSHIVILSLCEIATLVSVARNDNFAVIVSLHFISLSHVLSYSVHV